MIKSEDTEARHAAQHAKAVRNKALEDTGEIAALSNRLRTLRETNHFADLIRAALNGEAHRP
jgi:hypothetical protein